MAMVKPGYTKRGDTEMVWVVNMPLAGATVKAFVSKDDEVASLSVNVLNANDGRIAIRTDSLEVGKYRLEVQVSVDGKVATFPDSGYAQLIVVEDLAD